MQAHQSSPSLRQVLQDVGALNIWNLTAPLWLEARHLNVWTCILCKGHTVFTAPSRAKIREKRANHLHTLHSTLYTLYSTLHTLHSTLHTLHFTLHTLHSTLYTLHFTFHTLHFTLYTLHFTLCTFHSTL